MSILAKGRSDASETTLFDCRTCYFSIYCMMQTKNFDELSWGSSKSD